MASGSGGAIFLSYCTLVCESNNVFFRKNTATVGGALCTIASDVLIKGSTFEENTTYRYGGGVYFQGGSDETENDVRFLADSCTFCHNTATEFGGGLCFTALFDVSLTNLVVKYNQATFNGAGAYFVNIGNVYIYGSNFIGNELNNFGSLREKVDQKKSRIGLADLKPTTRGGGGIFVASDEDISHNQKIEIPRKFETHKCCFSQNFVGLKLFSKTPGHSILVEGAVQWDSFEDNVFNLSSSDLSYNPHQGEKSYEFSIYKMKKDKDEKCINDITADKSIDKDLLEKKTIIPKPTKFSYQQTPIVRAPHKTNNERKE